MMRRSDTLPVLGLAGAGLALTLMTTGCEVSIGAGSAGSEAESGESPGSTAGAGSGEGGGAAPTGDVKAATPSTRATPGGADAPGSSGTCGAGDLKVTLKEDEDGLLNNVVVALALTNTSAAACVVPKGWAPLGLREGGGYRELRTMRENHPDSGEDIILKPGGTAYAGVTWTAGADCTAVGELGVRWDGQWLPAPGTWIEIGRPTLCEAARPSQGTFQPNLEDVLYW